MLLLQPTDPTSWIIYMLACFRLSLLISKEDGPYWIFKKIRAKFGKEAKQHKAVQKSKLRQGINCIFCVSVWMAAPIMVYLATYDLQPIWLTQIGDAFLFMLALSAASIIINQHNTKGSL
jgi:small-conductance mechanosensitive channel